jgi:protein subunit release factor B
MKNKKRNLLFSITKKDFTIQTFKSGGKGGQHQNTTDSGVRIIHKESGAVGISRDGRSQHQNKKTAFERLTKSGKFKIWISRKVSEIDLGKSIEQQVEEDMKPHNLKVEVKDDNGKWSIE